MKYLKITLSIAIVLFAFSGCAHFKELEAPGKQGVNSTKNKLDSHKKTIKKQREHSSVMIKDNIFLSDKKIKITEKENMPSVFDKEITLVEQNPLYIYQIANRIAKLTGIKVYIPHEIKTIKTAEDEQEDSTFESTNRSRMVNNKVSQAENPKKLKIMYTGDLKNLLNIVTSHYGLFWKYKNGIIEFKEFDTKTFNLAASIGNITSESSMSNENEPEEAESGGNTSKNEQTTKMEYEYEIWENTVTNIRSLLSKHGKVVANIGAGTVTITDRPTVLNSVETYVDQINDRLSKQVAISAKIFSLKLSNEVDHQYGVDLIFKDIKDRFQFDMGVAGDVVKSISSSGGLSAAILEGENGNRNYYGAEWAESRAVLKALKDRGNVSLVTSGSGITLNNQPLPIQNLNRQGYLKSIETSVDEGVTSTEIVPGTVSTGFAMTVTPNILKNNSVILQYNLTLSSLEELTEFSSGGSTIQTPSVNTKSFMQRVRMNMGSTLLLAGFEKVKDEHNEGSNFEVLGKKHQSSSERSMIVILLQVTEVK